MWHPAQQDQQHVLCTHGVCHAHAHTLKPIPAPAPNPNPTPPHPCTHTHTHALRRRCKPCRIAITDHAAFVLVNVYVPNAGDRPDRPRLEYKIRFLQALKDKCDALAAQGREVSALGRALRWDYGGREGCTPCGTLHNTRLQAGVRRRGLPACCFFLSAKGPLVGSGSTALRRAPARVAWQRHPLHMLIEGHNGRCIACRGAASHTRHLTVLIYHMIQGDVLPPADLQLVITGDFNVAASPQVGVLRTLGWLASIRACRCWQPLGGPGSSPPVLLSAIAASEAPFAVLRLHAVAGPCTPALLCASAMPSGMCTSP